MAAEASASRPQEDVERRGMLLAILAVFAFATSPVFVLAAAPLSAFVITCGRLAVGALWVMLLGRLYRQPILPNQADLLLFVGIGLITAVHFLSYIASLNFTTIAQSLAIVYTAPIFVALFSALLLHEPISSRKWLGVLVTVLGIVILVGFQPQMDARMAFGDLLALITAITYGFYSVAGRSQRARYGLFTYAGAVYGLAALWALPAATLTLNPAALTPQTLAAVAAAGLIPQGIGHTLYNAALRRTHATIVNLIATQEVTGGIVLGALIFGQTPQASEIVGAVVALIGIAVVLI